MRKITADHSKLRRRLLWSSLAVGGVGLLPKLSYARAKFWADEHRSELDQLRILTLGTEKSPANIYVVATTDCSWCRLMLAGLMRFAPFARISVVIGTLNPADGLPLLASLPHVTDQNTAPTSEAFRKYQATFSDFTLGFLLRGDLAAVSTQAIAAAKVQDKRFRDLARSSKIEGYPAVYFQGDGENGENEGLLIHAITASLTEAQRLASLETYTRAGAATAKTQRTRSALNVAAFPNFCDGGARFSVITPMRERHLYIFFDPADARANLLWYTTQPFYFLAKFHWIPICDPDDTSSVIRANEMLEILAARPAAISNKTDDPDEFRWRMLQYKWKDESTATAPSRKQIEVLASMRKAAQRVLGEESLPVLAYVDLGGATNTVSGDISAGDLMTCVRNTRKDVVYSTYDIGPHNTDAAVLLEAENNAAAQFQLLTSNAAESTQMREFGLIEIKLDSESIYVDPGFKFFLTGTISPVESAASTDEAPPLRKSLLARLNSSIAILKARRAEEFDVTRIRLEKLTKKKIESSRASPVVGWTEIVVDREIFYISFDGKYLFDGSIIASADRRNLTEERRLVAQSIRFDELPFSQAITTRFGTGSRRMAIWVDPYCVYCKRLEAILNAEAVDLTVYRFIYPILGEKSKQAAEKILCDSDPAAAWQEIMAHQESFPATEGEQCREAVNQILTLGKRYRIDGTPTIFFPDGSRQAGVIPWPDIDALLKTRVARN